MQLQYRSVGRGRAVERDLAPHRLHIGLIEGDKGRKPDLKAFHGGAGLAPSPLEGGQQDLGQVALGQERMGQEPVGHLARHLRHQRTDRGHVDLGRAVGAGRGAELGGHQRVAIELALKTQGFAFVPGPPDGPQGPHVVAHASGRFRPRHGETLLDVGFDLAAQPQYETPLAEALKIMGQVGHRHRAARKGNGHRGTQLDAPGGRRRQPQRQEGVRGVLVAPGPFETQLLGLAGVGGGKLHTVAEAGVKLHGRGP